MPIPCFMSSCSTDLSLDPVTGALRADQRLADTGSLNCVDRADPDATDGLYVEIAGLTEDATSGILPTAVPCGQSLSRDTDGNMFAFPEGAVSLNYPSSSGEDGGSFRHIATPYATPTSGAPLNEEDHEVLIDNPFDCPAWCFYTIMEMGISGNRDDDADGNPFFYVGYGQVIVDVPAGFGAPYSNRFGTTNIHRVDVHGFWTPGAGNAPNHNHGWDMHALFRMKAGETGRSVINRITTLAKYRFSMVNNPGGSEGGVRMFHPAATFWREDCFPVRGFHGFPCTIAPNVLCDGTPETHPDYDCPIPI